MATPDFPCTQCGLCCKHVNLSPQTAFLDRGDGICHHLNLNTNLCSIYENRPSICNVNKQYNEVYRKKMPWVTFVELNLNICDLLQKSNNQNNGHGGKGM